MFRECSVILFTQFATQTQEPESSEQWEYQIQGHMARRTKPFLSHKRPEPQNWSVCTAKRPFLMYQTQIAIL